MHEESHNGSRQFLCEVCNKGCISKDDMKSHMKKVHKKEMVEVKVVEHFIPEKLLSDVKMNIEDIKDEPPEIVDHPVFLERDTSFKSSDERPFKSQICEKRSTHTSSRNTHEKIHYGDQSFACDICQMCFTSAKYLKVHKKTHIDERPFKCHCGKGYRRRTNMLTHQRTHTGLKPHSCDICEKSFRAVHHLKTHKNTHTDGKPYKCRYCEKDFGRRPNKIAHERIHTGNKPYTCDICEKSFSYNHHMKAHKRSHTGEKPFNCQFCGQAFARAWLKKMHEKTHNGSRQFLCEVCNKGCISKADMKSHMKKVHKKEMVEVKVVEHFIPEQLVHDVKMNIEDIIKDEPIEIVDHPVLLELDISFKASDEKPFRFVEKDLRVHPPEIHMKKYTWGQVIRLRYMSKVLHYRDIFEGS
ncbi:hypothetical protein JTB14_006890 [Gonioctena quinquepunctata]|nr:hypothetical protein JTB14_006890 [Gonioctena quinquepunctata]